MLRLRLLGKVFKSNSSLCRPNPGLPWLLHDSSRNFCTVSEEQPQQDPSPDPFLRTPIKGLIYGRLTGTGKNTLKTDIVHFFEGCNLTTVDIKVDYNRAYSPLGMVLQFPSRSAFDAALRLIARKGRLYRLEKVDRGHWDILTSYDGKVALLSGIPRNALPEDVERFLSGCKFDASNLQMLVRPGFPDPIRLALIPFSSQTEAMNAMRVKNRGFCLNNQISVTLLILNLGLCQQHVTKSYPTPQTVDVPFEVTLYCYTAFQKQLALEKNPPTARAMYKPQSNCSYSVEIETTCAPLAGTTDIVGIRFGDLDGNHVIVRRLKNPKLVFGPRKGVRNQGSMYNGFERCSIDMFEVNGMCMTKSICYLYLKRVGSDEWRPGWAKVLHRRNDGGLILVSSMFYFRTFLPENVWFGFDYCSSNRHHLPLIAGISGRA